ncbi:MAG: LPS assembly protein LptD, partial [Nitrospinota bacterium]
QFAPPPAPPRPAETSPAPPGGREGAAPSGEGLRFLRDPAASAAISADQLQEDRERQRVIGQGFADVRYLDKRIQADYVEVQSSTRDGVATGNIVFQVGNDRIIGTRIEFNLDSERVVIYDARGYIGGTYYITGGLLRRLAQDHYEIVDGTFTTCEGDRPDWAMRFRRGTFQIEGYGIIEGPAVEVAGIPAAYLPAAVVPVKTQRATGLLIPQFGAGNRNGFQYSPSFFWAINEWSDATLGFDYLTKRGFRYKGEYRYALSQNTTGIVRGRLLQDKLEKTDFWDLKADHRTLFPGDVEFTSFIDLARQEVVDRSLETDLAERTRQATDTRIQLIKDFAGTDARFQAGMRRQEGLNESDGQLFQKLPEIRLDILQSRIGTSDFYKSLNTSYVNFRRELNRNPIELERFHLEPRISLPLQTVPWLGVTPEAGFRETYWTVQKAGETAGPNPTREERREDGLSREMWFASLTVLGPRFSRVYEGKVGPLNDMKHIAGLETIYRYSPAMDPHDRRLIIPLDGVDGLGDENTVTYAIVNRFLTKLVTEEGGFETRQLARVAFGQTFDIAEARRAQDLDTQDRRPFGPVILDVESRPTRQLRLIHQTRYSTYEREISSHTTGFRLEGGRNWFFNADRTWQRLRNRSPASAGESFINLAGGVAITPRFFVEYLTRLNKAERATLEQSIILRYQGCCWGVALTLTDTRDKSEVFLSFSVLGLREGSRLPTFRHGRTVADEGRFLGGSGGLAPMRMQTPEITP